jgi:hypothetical protein
MVQGLVDIEQEKTRGYDFSSKPYSFPAVYPKKISVKDRTEAQRKSSASTLDSISKNLNLFDGVSASSYIDDKAIKNTFSTYLTQMGYEETEVENFVQGFIQQLPNFSVKPIKENVVTNGQKTPQMSLEIQNPTIGYSDTPSTGSTIVPEDFMYIVRNFPQTIISHRILKQIIENKPKNLNEVYGL